MEAVRERFVDGPGRRVSIQSWKEHVGQISGYEYISVCGRIPGILWGGIEPVSPNLGRRNPAADLYRADGTLIDPFEIERRWRKTGIEPADPICFYCGTGWRASEA